MKNSSSLHPTHYQITYLFNRNEAVNVVDVDTMGNQDPQRLAQRGYGENGYVLPVEVIERILFFTTVQTLLACMATNRDIAARILAMLRRNRMSVQPFSICRWCITPAGDRLPCVCFRDNPNISWGDFWKYSVLSAPRRDETTRIIRELRDELREVTESLRRDETTRIIRDLRDQLREVTKELGYWRTKGE